MGVYEKPVVNMNLNDERLNSFSQRMETNQGFLLSPFLFSLVLEVLASAIGKKSK